jgi:hypothetical protein
MSDKVQPALTPEEWAGPVVPGEPTVSRDGECLHMHLYPQMDLLVVGEWGVDARHALAALALHGQPFGFTWADVLLLQGMASFLAVHGMDDSGMRDVAGRIAALLPPREDA